MGGPAPRRTPVLGALAAAVVLVLSAPPPWQGVRQLSATATALDATGPLVALVGLLAWSCAAGLLLSAALTAGSRLPGPAGQALARVTTRLVPGAVRRSLEVALGLTLVTGALASPALAAAPAAPAPVSAPGSPALDHPTGGSALPGSLDWPATPVGPGAPGRALPEAPHASVVVQPGDSLWSIAARQLGASPSAARVAEAWPSWWQANREVVGDDPDLLRPGAHLVPPAAP